MKRSELKVGDELYCDSPKNFQDARAGRKVTVLAIEPYGRRVGYVPRGESQFIKIGKGSGVLVARGTDQEFRDVVQLGHLHGPYDEVAAEVAKRRAEREAREQKERADRLAARNWAVALVNRATAMGFTGTSVHGYHGRTPGVTMGSDTFERLLNAIEGSG